MRSATLQAIHLLENPRDVRTPGRHGELGAYQFRRAVWRKYTSDPFRNALNRRASDQVAVCHYEWLKAGLEGNGIEATPYAIALAWNGGLDAELRGASSSAARDYARRAANLVADFSVEMAAAK